MPSDILFNSVEKPLEFIKTYWEFRRKPFRIPSKFFWKAFGIRLGIHENSPKNPLKFLRKSFGMLQDILWDFLCNSCWNSFGYPLEFLWRRISWGNPSKCLQTIFGLLESFFGISLACFYFFTWNLAKTFLHRNRLKIPQTHQIKPIRKISTN